MAFYLRNRPVDVERCASAAHGGVFNFPQHRDDGFADACRRPFAALYPQAQYDDGYPLAAVFDDFATSQYDDHGDVCVSGRTQAHLRKRIALSQRNGVFGNWHGAGRYRGAMATGQ